MIPVRPGTGLDEEDAVAVWQAAEAARGRRSGGTRAQRVRARLRARDALLLVAEREDAVVGVLLAELARDERGVLEVALLSVRPAAQRSGVGRALLHALVARYPRVRVRPDDPDAAALALLRSARFVPEDGPDGFWRSPSGAPATT